MKAEAKNKFFKFNDDILETGDSNIFQRIEKPSVYEVIRVMDGVPLFLDDHLDRMFKSASMIDYNIPYDKSQIKASIRDIIIKNGVKNQNIKLLASDVANENVFLVYFVDSFYPPKEYYKNGIKTILFDHERDNPNAKVQRDEFRNKVKEALEDKDAFEALLKNKDGYIPEGSRSNMFFVMDNKIYTGPSKEVLLGITRKYIFNLAEILDIDIIEETIHRDDLGKLEGAFMSGSSVGVLPITRIDNMIIESTDNQTINSLYEAYNQLVEQSIEDNKSYWSEGDEEI